MPTAFRGTQVVIESLRLASVNGAPFAEVAVQFRDDAGNVHGVVQHHFSLVEPEAPLRAAVKELMTLITQKVTEIHFSDAPTTAPDPQALIGGIAEALRDDGDDLFGEQA